MFFLKLGELRSLILRVNSVFWFLLFCCCGMSTLPLPHLILLVLKYVFLLLFGCVSKLLRLKFFFSDICRAEFGDILLKLGFIVECLYLYVPISKSTGIWIDRNRNEKEWEKWQKKNEKIHILLLRNLQKWMPCFSHNNDNENLKIRSML